MIVALIVLLAAFYTPPVTREVKNAVLRGRNIDSFFEGRQTVLVKEVI